MAQIAPLYLTCVCGVVYKSNRHHKLPRTYNSYENDTTLYHYKSYLYTGHCHDILREFRPPEAHL